jgi:archaemetzincin
VTDNKIKSDFISKVKKYCEAFFYGMKVKIKHIVGTKTGAEFMESLEIPNRESSLWPGAR